MLYLPTVKDFISYRQIIKINLMSYIEQDVIKKENFHLLGFHYRDKDWVKWKEY